MKDKIRALIELQGCDNRIERIMEQRRQGPARIQALARELDEAAHGFQDDDERLTGLQEERRSLEKEIEEVERNIRKSNEKLSNIKSNKEYGAALQEIEDLQKKKAGLEDMLIQRMEELDEVSRRCEVNKEKLEALRKKLEEDKKEVQSELKELEIKLKEAEADREKVTRKVDPELLSYYNLVRQRLGTQAVSPVVGGVCQTCHMGIPPQKFNELMKCLELESCPHCNRIIYWGEDDYFQDLTNA